MFRLFDNPRIQLAFQVVGYALFFCLVAAIALPFTFPTRQLRSYVSRQARAQGFPLEIEDLKLRGLGGVELLGVKLTLPGKPGEPGENGAVGPGVPETELRIERLNAKLGLWSALMGRTLDVHFEMDAGGGKLEDGRALVKGDSFDVEIGKLTDVALGEMGVGQRLLAGNKSLGGQVDGDLNGTAKLHYAAGGEDMSGDVDLELADAILKSPELEGGLRMTDLGLGTITLKVKIGLKSNIAALAAARGSDKATVIHIEKMEAGGEGADVEILTDETAHILIPPGKGMWKQASLQLHFAINLNEREKKEPKKKDDKAAAEESGDEEEKAEKPADDRVKWSKILTLFGSKLKPFERAGYIGIGCTGPLLRPQCKPELPVVGVGTRGKAPVGGTGPETPQAPGTPGAPATTPGPAQPPAVAAPVPAPTPVPDFRPAVLTPTPTPAPIPNPPAPATPEPPKAEEKKPEPAKAEPAADERKAADEERGGRNRRNRGDDEELRGGDRGGADEEDDRPRRRSRDEGDEERGRDEGEPPPGE